MGAGRRQHRPGALRQQPHPQRLAGLVRGWGDGSGPRAILACPPGEWHDLALMIFGVTLNRHGWRIDYLGVDTPVEEHRWSPQPAAALL